MEDALHENDVGIAVKCHNVKNGDIIVFEATVCGESEMLVKRVIASGGETVRIAGGIVYVDDMEIEDAASDTCYTDDLEECIVPLGHYFVLGDNRESSYDSRYDEIGFVPEESVTGVFFKL